MNRIYKQYRGNTLTIFEIKACQIPQKYRDRLNNDDMNQMQKEIAEICEYFYNRGKADSLKDPNLRKMIANEAVLSDD